MKLTDIEFFRQIKLPPSWLNHNDYLKLIPNKTNSELCCEACKAHNAALQASIEDNERRRRQLAQELGRLGRPSTDGISAAEMRNLDLRSGFHFGEVAADQDDKDDEDDDDNEDDEDDEDADNHWNDNTLEFGGSRRRHKRRRKTQRRR